MVMALNIRLSTGWNPFFSDEDARLYTFISVVCEKYLKEKGKELRPDSIRVYSSFLKIFQEWINKFANNIEYCSMFNKLTAVKFMDYMYSEKNLSARSYNNFLKLGRSFFNWAKEKSYVKENPFELIKTKPKQQKIRKIIPHDYRETITNYLLSFSDDKNYLLILKLIYGALMRPSEIRKIKIENVDLQNRTIVVPPEVSKNKKQRFIPLTDDILADLEALKLYEFPKSFYVFGRELKPNSIALSA
jgi:site-specific recombinase XerD